MVLGEWQQQLCRAQRASRHSSVLKGGRERLETMNRALLCRGLCLHGRTTLCRRVIMKAGPLETWDLCSFFFKSNFNL